MVTHKKGQLSAEMLILLAVILAVALLVASQLLNTTNDVSKKVDSRANALMCAGEPGCTGSTCQSDGECTNSTTNTCVSGTCR